MKLQLSTNLVLKASIAIAFSLISTTGVIVVTAPAHAGSPHLESELAEMDAAAATLGSIRSWVNNEPEAAIDAFKNHESIRRYLDQKFSQYSTDSKNRLGDRHKAIEAAIKEWDQFVSSYQESQPKQIATELKRQRDAVERYRRSKSPRPGSFAYIPKTVWQTKDKLEVLTASGAETRDLQIEQQKVQDMVTDFLKTLDVEVIAKKNGYVRDAYKKSDRDIIESYVRSSWAHQNSSIAINRIVMPKSSWSSTYAARVDPNSSRVIPYEVERMTVYVVTQRTDSISTLHPVRLMREHYRINGKRIGKIGPQELTRIPSNEFPFDVLQGNIR